MDVGSVYEVGVLFKNKGRLDLAQEIWKECTATDKNFSPAFVELVNFYKMQGNAPQERNFLIGFLNCYVNGITQDLIPQAKARLQELEKAMGLIK